MKDILKSIFLFITISSTNLNLLFVNDLIATIKLAKIQIL
jgi:hypothetical protein